MQPVWSWGIHEVSKISRALLFLFSLFEMTHCLNVTDPSPINYPRRYHDPEAGLEEGLATMKRCIDEVSKRLVVSPGKYKVKVVDKDGVREVEL